MFRRVLVVLLTVFAILAGVAGILASLLRHEPGYYSSLAQPAGKERKQRSREFFNAFTMLLQDVADPASDRPTWSAKFLQEDVNSFLDEDLSQCGAEKFLPDGVREPRFRFEQDRVRLGFRYELFPRWSSVVTIDVRLWLSPNEANAIVLELLGMKAGALPISAQSLLERVSETARAQNIDVTWYRYNGHPAALLRFRPSPKLRLNSLDLHDGVIRISGGTNEMMSSVKGAKLATPPVAN